MINNDDPIKEFGLFRRNVEDLRETNSDYTDDLHNCSNDLSNEGSIKEEIAHAQFAKRKKEEMLRYNDMYTLKNANINIKKAKKSFSIGALLFIIFLYSILHSIYQFNTVMEYEPDIENKDYISYEKPIEINEQNISIMKNNISIQSTILQDNIMILDIKNDNNNTLNYVKVQVIFFDNEDKPIKICEQYINTLFANDRNIVRVYDIPEYYERMYFLIDESYVIENREIDFSRIDLYGIQDEEGNFDIKLTNNTEYDLSSVSIAVIYYKDNQIVDMHEKTMYDIKSGVTEYDNIYNYQDIMNYDMVSIVINDIWIDE